MSKKPTYKELEQKVKLFEKAYDELVRQMEGRTGELMAINKQLHQEIIDRQEAQEQLALFHQFVEASREGMGWADLDGCVRYINSTLCSMFGETKPEDSYGRPVLEYYSEEAQRRLQEEIFPTVLREGTWTGELVIHSSTGSLIPTTNSLVVLRDAEGNPSSFANVLTDLTKRKQAEDELRRHRVHLEEIVAERTSSLKQSNQKLQQEITERKKAEEALQDSEKQYRLLADNVSDVIWVRDMNLNLTYVSPSVKDQQGYTVEEAMNRTPEEIWSPDSLKFVAEVLTEELEIEKQEKKDLARSRTLEVEVKCKDGSTIWSEAKMSFLRDQDSHPTGIIGVTRDISERKRVEEALRESESKFRNLFDLSPQAVALTEIKSGRLIDVNNKLCELTKYTKEEIVGVNTTEVGFYLEADRSKFLKELQASGEVNGLDMRFKAKDHSILHTIMFARIIQIEGKSFILTIFHDITEQKRLEAQLQQAQKMESIGTLAGGIAHDFNNILFPMMGFAEMVLEDVPKDSPLRNSIKEILQGTKRARDLVKQILAFSRQADQELKPLKVQLVVKEVLKLMRSSLPTTIEIKHDISNECGLVMADHTQIHQVAMNLMTNAFQTMEDEGGVLGVTLKEVELAANDLTGSSMTPGSYVCLTVTDTGLGIDQSTINHIFEPYFTTKENGKGTGLGLAVVHGIVKSFDGDIKVYSEPGKGTAFHVYLPVIKSQFETEETEAIESAPGGTERILLVDDEETIVRMEKQMLERLGYDVTERTSSIEALEAFRAAPDKFDLVITDMTMPNMTGDKLAKEIINIRSDIPVILCTGFSKKISSLKADAVGLKGLLMKPIIKNDLAKTVRAVLDES